eukprot:scaffold6420_cov168-Amphora_coffeaeformis.AAC.4
MDLFESYTLWNEKLSVPGFVFMSGFLGKGFLPTAPTGRKADRRWEKTISVLLFGSGLVQLVYLVLGLILEKMLTGTVTWSVGFPLWEKLETWYLIALFLWRLSTPLIGRLKWPIIASFMVAFICVHAEFQGPMDMRYVFGLRKVFSAFIPYNHSPYFCSISRMRVLHFLPYYVVGLYCEEKHLNSIRRPRLVGVVGILSTFAICVLVDPSTLGHVYFVPSWELTPHLVFFLQYVLCGAEVLSVILLFRSISSPVFPYSHANSTLAIYEWHWPVVGTITWGEVPFTHANLPLFSNASPFIFIARQCHPMLTLLLAHLFAYAICICLGSTAFWRLVRHISDPECGGCFVSSMDGNLNTKPNKDMYCCTEKLLKKQECFDPEKGRA